MPTRRRWGLTTSWQVFNQAKQQWLTYQRSVNEFDRLLVQGLREQAKTRLFASNPLFGALEQAVNALIDVNLGFVKENRSSLLGSVSMVTTFAMVSIGALLIFMVAMTWFPDPPDLSAAASRGSSGQCHCRR